MGRMHRVREQHGFVVGQGIQEIIVALNECCCFSLLSLRGMMSGL